MDKIDANGLSHNNAAGETTDGINKEVENDKLLPITDKDLANQADKSSEVIKIQQGSPRRLIYTLTDTPPTQYLILFALQQALLAISAPLGITLIVSEAVCAVNEDEIKVRILCSIFLMMGVATFCMTTFGVRLPVFQGPSSLYIFPLLALASLEEYRCPETYEVSIPNSNKTKLMAIVANGTSVPNSDIVISRINSYAGTLMIVGVVHFLIGFTGVVGVLARFIGPITIVPVVCLFGFYIQVVIIKFSETYWPAAILTSAICLTLGLYLANRKTPIPMWSRSKGFYIVWQPIQQYFALLISLISGWLFCLILTECGVFTDDKNNKQFKARSDARIDTVYETPWFILPYPGQFGVPSFHLGALITFIIATIISLLDSIGDYNATAKVTRAPPPPVFSINRGIAVEGLMTILGGSMGCGVATMSYGSNIGLMGLTKVVSRTVFQLVGIFYIIIAVVGKFGAFIISIPYPVVGGVQFITFGLFLGVCLGYLQSIDLNSNRNLSIIGISFFMGVMLPQYLKDNPDDINTGSFDGDNILTIMLTNPSFVGGVLACFLDNTVPGTKEERGISVQIEELEAFDHTEQSNFLKDKTDVSHYETGPEVYRLPFISSRFRGTKLARWIPIFYTFRQVQNK